MDWMEESMSVQMNKIKCTVEDCKFENGCLVVNTVENGARFSPILKLRLEDLTWKLKCFSYTSKKTFI